MISCPGCGTTNRRGSRFCGHCGQPLDPTPDISCPECNRLNPSDSIYCAFCGARVVSLTAEPVEASAGPVVEPAPAESDATVPREVPSWLYEPREAAESGAPAPAAEAAPVPSPAHSSKYLEDIEGALPGAAGWLPVNARAEPLPKVELPTPIAARKQGCLAILPLLLWHPSR